MNDSSGPGPSDDSPTWIVLSSDRSEQTLLGNLQQVVLGMWQSRELAKRLFVRNLVSEYRQSLLGWLWIFLPALANAAVWVLLNSSGTVRISQLSGLSYAAFVFVGTVLWQAFTDGLVAPMNTLQANRSPLTKLPFPKEVFVVVSLAETAFDFVARILVGLILLAVAGFFAPLGAVLLLLVWGPLLMILGLAGGLILAPFGLLYKDVSKSLTMLLPVWMLLTPVIYPMPHHQAATWIAWLNPPAALVHVGRNGIMPLSDSPQPEASPETIAATAGDDRDQNLPTPASQSVIEVAKPAGQLPRFLWPAIFWGIGGCLLAVAGTVWLRITSPIVIERLAN